MIRAPARMSLRCPATCMAPSHLPFQSLLSCRIVSAHMPSCLYSAVLSWPYHTTLPHRNNWPKASLLPSSLYSFLSPTSSRSHSSFVDSQSGTLAGLSMMGLKGRVVRDLRMAAKKTTPRTNGTNVRSMAGQSAEEIEETIKRSTTANAVVVYAKTWCPYCGMVKGLFTKLGVPFKVVELDELIDEQDVEEALARLTGQRTVPNVFIGGKHIGGCDDTMALHERGELIPALEAAGLKVPGA